MPSPFNVDRMLRKAATKPLAIAQRCRDQMEKLEAGYHQRLYDIVSVAYASAWHLRKNSADWRRLLKKPFWKKAKEPKGEKGVREELHRVMMYVCDAVTDQAYDRAHKYARALEPYLVERVPPTKVRERIESDGGLEKLYDRAKKEIPLRKGGGKKPDEQEWNNDDLELDARPQDNDDDEGRRDGEMKASLGRTAQPRRLRLTLDIEISAKKLDRVFAMSEGREATVRIKALDVEKGWHRFRATKLKIPGNSGESSRVEPTERRKLMTVSARKVHVHRSVPSPPRPSSIPPRRQHRR